MLKSITYIIVGLLCAVVISFAPSKQQEPIVLFKQSVDDWFTEGDARWEFIEGDLVASLDSGYGFVMTNASYDNFELSLEFYPDDKINSGVFIRCADTQISATECYEINIYDLHPNQEFRTGAIVTRQSPKAFVKTNGKWNNYRIRCQGNRVQAWVNGTVTADLTDEQLARGYIALQAMGEGTIRFRKVQLTQLAGSPKE